MKDALCRVVLDVWTVAVCTFWARSRFVSDDFGWRLRARASDLSLSVSSAGGTVEVWTRHVAARPPDKVLYRCGNDSDEGFYRETTPLDPALLEDRWWLPADSAFGLTRAGSSRYDQLVVMRFPHWFLLLLLPATLAAVRVRVMSLTRVRVIRGGIAVGDSGMDRR